MLLAVLHLLQTLMIQPQPCTRVLVSAMPIRRQKKGNGNETCFQHQLKCNYKKEGRCQGLQEEEEVERRGLHGQDKSGTCRLP